MTERRLLFDENLSPRFVKLLAESFPNSMHIDDAGLLMIQMERSYP